jgi:PleD family two-component response regulator
MSPTKKKIFVVDDDEKHLLTTREILELAGYEVVVHNSPFRSSEVIKAVSPDLILLDVNMPALSGDRLCSLLKGHSAAKNLPILLYSSNDEDSLRRSVAEFGADGYVCKGDISGLRNLVGRMLNG